jgi:hypothetical protein
MNPLIALWSRRASSSNGNVWSRPCSLDCWLGVIVAISLVARLYVIWWRTPMLLGGDESEYVSLAQNLLRQSGFVSGQIQRVFQGGNPGEPTAYRSPVLPAFLAAHYLVFGFRQVVPRVVLATLSALTGLALGLGAKALGWPRAGCVAALTWALWPPAVIGPYAADRYCPETLGVVLLVGHIVILMGKKSISPGRAAMAGLLVGLAALTRGYLAPLVVVSTLWVAAERGRTTRRDVMILLLLAILPVGGWVLRNQRVMGRAMLSTQTDHFYLGNNAWARGSFNGDMLAPMSRGATGLDLERQIEAVSPQIRILVKRHPQFWHMSEIERSDMWSQEAWLSIRGNPGRFAWLIWRKSAVFWGPFQYWSVGAYRFHYAFLVVLPLAPIGLIAIARGHGKRQAVILLLPIMVVYCAALATHSFDRYRFTIEPFVILLAAIGASSIAERLLANLALQSIRPHERCT